MSLKIKSPKQMLQRLPIALAQVQIYNTSETLLNEILHITYFFVSSKRNYKATIQQDNEFDEDGYQQNRYYIYEF